MVMFLVFVQIPETPCRSAGNPVSTKGQPCAHFAFPHVFWLCAARVTEEELFSTDPTGWLPARMLMTSIWGSHRFPVALIKSRLIKTFAIHPELKLFFFLLFISK